MEIEKDDKKETSEIVLGQYGQGIILESSNQAKGSQGYTTVIAQRGIQEGCFYFEIKVISYGKNGNIRVGITNDTLNNVLETPVGTDIKSFGLRCSDGYSFNNRQGKQFTQGLKENDVIALVVLLDALEPPGTKSGRVSESQIFTFINGEYCGIMYQGLLAQKYFAAASLYNESEVQFNLKESEYNYLEKIPAVVRHQYKELEHLRSYDYVAKNQPDFNYTFYKQI